MVARETYYCSCGQSFEASDALQIINPNEIKEAVDSFVRTIESVGTELSTDIEKVRPDVGESIRSEGKTYEPALIELNDNIKEKMNALSDAIIAEDYPTKAEAKFDELQTSYNNAAKQKAMEHEEMHKKAA